MRELFRLTVQELSEISGERLPDSDLIITRASSFANPMPNSLVFAKKMSNEVMDYFDDLCDALVLMPADASEKQLEKVAASNVVVRVPNPRLSFANIMNAALSRSAKQTSFSERNGAWIADGVELPASVHVEPGVLIDHHVEIGENVCILSGAKIRAYTTIGRGCIVRENAVVGSQGFGFERDTEGVPIRLPHCGGVRIGSGVEIGAFSVVCAGTIEPTIIEDHVKIDNLVHIAHNCLIERGCMITACSEISGSVRIGEMTWLGPNCCIIEGRTIGRKVTIGIGAVVLKDVPDGHVIGGNPARTTTELSRINSAIRQLVSLSQG